MGTMMTLVMPTEEGNILLVSNRPFGNDVNAVDDWLDSITSAHKRVTPDDNADKLAALRSAGAYLPFPVDEVVCKTSKFFNVPCTPAKAVSNMLGESNLHGSREFYNIFPEDPRECLNMALHQFRMQATVIADLQKARDAAMKLLLDERSSCNGNAVAMKAVQDAYLAKNIPKQPDLDDMSGKNMSKFDDTVGMWLSTVKSFDLCDIRDWRMACKYAPSKALPCLFVPTSEKFRLYTVSPSVAGLLRGLPDRVAAALEVEVGDGDFKEFYKQVEAAEACYLAGLA